MVGMEVLVYWLLQLITVRLLIGTLNDTGPSRST